MLRILPKPQRLEEKEGTLFLDYHCRITIKDNCPEEAYFYAKQLSEQFEHSTGIELSIDRRTKKPHKGIVLCIDETAGSEKTKKAGKEAYCLTITPEGATVKIQGISARKYKLKKATTDNITGGEKDAYI